jgi:hypothetical protein
MGRIDHGVDGGGHRVRLEQLDLAVEAGEDIGWIVGFQGVGA